MPAENQPIKRLYVPTSNKPAVSGEAVDLNAARRVVSQSALRHASDEITEREARTYEIQSGKADFARDERATVNFDVSQLEALDMMTREQYCALIGAAGTGKTTVMSGYLPKIRHAVPEIDWGYARSAGTEPSGILRPAIALCTFTNVAAMNLAAKLPEEWAQHCMSIHSLLAFAPVDFEYDSGTRSQRFEPRYTSLNKMPYRVVIIDEVGIVSRDLWDQLYDALLPETQVIFLGDIAQLPAMRGVSPMPFAMKQWPTKVLDTIHRQKGTSSIIPNLTRIRKGIFPEHSASDFRCDKAEKLDENTLKARTQITKYIAFLHQNGVWDPKQDIIITPENDAALGQAYFNGAFRFAFNPVVDDLGRPIKPEFKNKGREVNPPIMVKTAIKPITLQVGDKVMATTNGGRRATEIRFNNGSIGVVTAILPNPEYKGVIDDGDLSDLTDLPLAQMFDEVTSRMEAMEDHEMEAIASEDTDERMRQASHIVVVTELATGQIYHLSRSGEVGTLTHAYAVTCHRFQGSQARHVMVICHRSMQSGLYREWLYTACSRAKDKVFLMHDDKALQKAIITARIAGRSAEEKADSIINLYKAGRDWAIPRLPEPQSLRNFL